MEIVKQLDSEDQRRRQHKKLSATVIKYTVLKISTIFGHFKTYDFFFFTRNQNDRNEKKAVHHFIPYRNCICAIILHSNTKFGTVTTTN